MKLSLQMVADQLENSDIALHINETGDVSYRSSRTYVSEGNLYVAQEGEDAYVYGRYPDSYILLKNTSMERAQNQVLDIFDRYAEWMEKIERYLEEDDYQNFIDTCYEIFRDPIFIMNYSGKLIALTKRIDGKALNNPEWEHLSTYGYSSVRNYNKFKDAIHKQDAKLNSTPVYFKNPPTADRTNFMVSIVCHNRSVYGRITVMEYFRKLTDGDARLLKHISDLAGRHMYYQGEAIDRWEGDNIVFDLLVRKKVSGDKLKQLMDFYSWQSGNRFRVCVLDCKKHSETGGMGLVRDYFGNFFQGNPLAVYEDKVVVILNEDVVTANELLRRLNNPYVNELGVRVGLSLEFYGLHRTYEYYLQAVYAAARLEKDGGIFYLFYNCALEYILASDSREKKLAALHPDVADQIRKEGTPRNENLNTLYKYLMNERSPSRTSKAMHIHRNTLLYRINKLAEEMRYSLEDDYTREYIVISVMIANMLILEEG